MTPPPSLHSSQSEMDFVLEKVRIFYFVPCESSDFEHFVLAPESRFFSSGLYYKKKVYSLLKDFIMFFLMPITFLH